MSKHHNYQNYSKPNNQPVEPTPVVEEEVVETVKEAVEEIVEETVEETPVSLTGVVSGCTKLNVRRLPNPNGEVVCVLNEGNKVEIDEDKSTEVFYKVCTVSGVEGYCMKKFITVK